MPSRTLRILSIFLSSLFVIGFVVVIYLWRTGKIGKPPEELSPETANFEAFDEDLQDFDVTQEPAVFAVEGVNKDDQTFLLHWAFPLTRRGQTIVAKVTCPLSDSFLITISTKSQETQRTVVDQPLYLLADPTKDTLQGICTDDSCQEISQGCEIVREAEE